MPSSISKSIKHRRDKKANSKVNQPQRANPIYIASAITSGDTLELSFDQAVSLHGTPGLTTDIAGAEPVSAQQIAPGTVAITYSNAITGATVVNIPYRDPAIRNESGGYVTGNTFSNLT